MPYHDPTPHLATVLDVSYNALAVLDTGTLASMQRLRWLGADGNDFGATLLADDSEASSHTCLPAVKVSKPLHMREISLPLFIRVARVRENPTCD